MKQRFIEFAMKHQKRLIITAMVFAIVIIAAISFHASCNAPLTAVHDPLPNDQLNSIEPYLRPEESTYLTFPEWYLVFNPQEYGGFLATHKPSYFPYARSIGQFWSSYCKVSGMTKKNYPFNPGNHLMISVIGTSFTVEYLVKGIYEHTIGKLSELTIGNELTEEDQYAASVAIEYGAFIPHLPWYEFPYAESFSGVWKLPFWSSHPLRSWERKLFLSTEYGIKAIYALLIKVGTRAVYGVADTEVFAVVDNVPERVFDNNHIRKVESFADGSYLVALPHYQGFTDTVPGLVQEGVQFVSVAGNDEMLVTIITPRSFEYLLGTGTMLFQQDMLTFDAKRIALQVPVRSLTSVLQEIMGRGIKIEHLFDY